MKRGNEWAEEYREIGELKHQTIVSPKSDLSSEERTWHRKMTFEAEVVRGNTAEEVAAVQRSSSFHPDTIARSNH